MQRELRNPEGLTRRQRTKTGRNKDVLTPRGGLEVGWWWFIWPFQRTFRGRLGQGKGRLGQVISGTGPRKKK